MLGINGVDLKSHIRTRSRFKNVLTHFESLPVAPNQQMLFMRVDSYQDLLLALENSSREVTRLGNFSSVG
ncbi:hypothetical protein Q7C36_008738 [Tachysurus vachellii]|uniref:Uncharacterized protein n=1 Tax=Tachysurus vachellii TaxID=175792 RepID=A0AA88N256_TACVA|nr:hypothetical protein Q7C36_008738 [Tachysurus vachellii]